MSVLTEKFRRLVWPGVVTRLMLLDKFTVCVQFLYLFKLLTARAELSKYEQTIGPQASPTEPKQLRNATINHTQGACDQHKSAYSALQNTWPTCASHKKSVTSGQILFNFYLIQFLLDGHDFSFVEIRKIGAIFKYEETSVITAGKKKTIMESP